MKLGLDNIRSLLEGLGNPQNAYKCIHVAGTNGKGSVSAMLAAALQANGYKVGLYTSPHLVDFRERIKVNGVMISRDDVQHFLAKIWNTVEELNATFFEVTTALAFDHFKHEHVDIAIIETGLGGRLDATNVLEHPIATVVTSISLEHTQFLGDTLELIAYEKAGILKHRSPAIVSVEESLHHVFIDRARAVGTTILFTKDFSLPEEYARLETPFIGEHQRTNLRTVLATLQSLHLPLRPNDNIEGIHFTPILTGLRARLEEYPDSRFIAKGAHLLLDVAHNPEAFKMLADHFDSVGLHPRVIIGLASDKDRMKIFAEVQRFASQVICVQALNQRAVDSVVLTSEALHFGIKAIDGMSVNNGIMMALAQVKQGEHVVLCGSHYVVGEYLADRKTV